MKVGNTTKDNTKTRKIREVVAASDVPLSFREIQDRSGVSMGELGSALNKLVRKLHLNRTGVLGSFRYSMGPVKVRIVPVLSEEERKERYRLGQLRRRDLEHGADRLLSPQERHAAKLARRAAKAAQTRAKNLKEREDEKAANKKRALAARAVKLEQRMREAEAKKASAPIRRKPVAVATRPSKHPRRHVAPRPSSEPAETVEQFLARGGQVATLAIGEVSNPLMHIGQGKAYGRSYQ